MRTPQEIRSAFSDIDLLSKVTRFGLLGIGGSGMSGLAILLLEAGHPVIGKDRQTSLATDELASRGATIVAPSDSLQLGEGDCLVLSDAIDLRTSEEYLHATELGVPVFRRTQVLSWIFRDKKVLAVTGSHGKSTTTLMLKQVAQMWSNDLSWFIGANMSDGSPPAHYDVGEYAVLELCEAYGGLGDITPFAAIVTNIEHEHKDFYPTEDDVIGEFTRFADTVQNVIIAPAKALGEVQRNVVDADSIQWPVDKPVALHGEHNRENARLVLGLGRELGVPDQIIFDALGQMTGLCRRQEMIFDGQTQKGFVTVYDDYAHHPTEIVATLKAIRGTCPDRRIVAVFQPHLYSRTTGAYKEFAHALDLADIVVLTEIYPAREEPIPGVSAVRIDEALTQESVYVPAIGMLARETASVVKDGDVVVFMGAGNIDRAAAALAGELDRFGVRRVVIAYGGDSPEREISIHSSLSAFEALKERYDVERIDFTDRLLKSGDMSFLIGYERPDVVLLAVHGTRAEDGAIQGLLELAHIPYTGCGIQSSALCVDKQATKKVLKQHNIPVASGYQIRKGDLVPPFQFPCVVKPNSQGSTVGMSFVEAEGQYVHAIHKALEFDDSVLVEEWLRGRELTVPVLGDRALPAIEIRPLTGQYDFANKYTPGLTEKICPAEVPEIVAKTALMAHQALGCRGLTRVDIILVGEVPYVLEINTLPGMTKTSLVSLSAKAAGIEFADMLTWMLEDAYARAHAR
jgi:D-alanine--D-alanine ligase